MIHDNPDDPKAEISPFFSRPADKECAPQRPLLANVVVDGVNTLPPGSRAEVHVSFDG
jgi:hypothetical protein